MITNIFVSVLVGLFILFLLEGCLDVVYNLKNNKTTEPAVWIIPAILAALAWFVYHL